MRFVALLLAIPLLAQQDLPADRVRRYEELFARHAGKGDLRCDVQPLRPLLNFAFRHQAGFRLSLPLAQFASGTPTQLLVASKITPLTAERPPAYLHINARLPALPPKVKAEGAFSGGYFVGEGRYRVDWLLVDAGGRSCRREWDFEVKLSGAEKEMGARQEPGTVAPLFLDPWRERDKAAMDAPGRPRRLTVLLHVSPLFPRAIKMSNYDQVLLLGSLTSVLEQMDYPEVRLVAFNLDQQRVLFETDRLDPRGFRTLVSEANKLQLGMVDINILRQRGGHIDLLADLVNREIESETPSEAVVFLGLTSRQIDRPPSELRAPAGAAVPPFFYFEYRMLRVNFPFKDVIERIVKQLNGRVLEIDHPRELAEALRTVRETIQQRRP